MEWFPVSIKNKIVIVEPSKPPVIDAINNWDELLSNFFIIKKAG